MPNGSVLGRSVRDNAARHLCGVVREPGGRVIANVWQEDPARVLERRVGERHRYRARDAWSLGAGALEQARALRVDVLRYIAPDGVYDVAFPDFEAQAERLPLAHERQFVLPRRLWRFTAHAPAAAEQIGLGIGAA